MKRVVLCQLCLLAVFMSAAEAQAAPKRAPMGQMDPRLDLLFRLGFGGTIEIEAEPVAIEPNAAATLGGDLRLDFPVHRFLTLGPVLGVYAAKEDLSFVDRNVLVDIAPFFKARYPFTLGGQRRAAETYLLLQVGLTLGFSDEDRWGSERFGPGWNIGFGLGFQSFVSKRVALLAEIGWTRSQANFDVDVIIRQGSFRLGPVIGF